MQKSRIPEVSLTNKETHVIKSMICSLIITHHKPPWCCACVVSVPTEETTWCWGAEGKGCAGGVKRLRERKLVYRLKALEASITRVVSSDPWWESKGNHMVGRSIILSVVFNNWDSSPACWTVMPRLKWSTVVFISSLIISDTITSPANEISIFIFQSVDFIPTNVTFPLWIPYSNLTYQI